MSRTASDRGQASQWGWVYTLHLLPAYGTGRQKARHYTGWASDLPARLAEHQAGGSSAARLLQVQKAAGGSWRVAAVEPGTRDREIQMKYRGASRRCPVCRAERAGLPQPPPVPIPEGPPPARLRDLGFPPGKVLAGPTGPGKPTAPRARRSAPAPAGASRRTGAAP